MHDHVTEELYEETHESSQFFQPRIYEGSWQQFVPENFDTITISIDGRAEADLDWKLARNEAAQAVEQGYAIMWDIELGLFDKLSYPLFNQTQFLTLALSLEHFRDTLWKEFKTQTVGLSLFRGPADFCQGFQWDLHQEENFKKWWSEHINLEQKHLEQQLQKPEEKEYVRLFCRDVSIEYLSLLASRLPDSLSVYLFVDATSLDSVWGEMMQLNPERYDRLNLAIKGQRLPYNALGWTQPTVYGYSGQMPLELPLTKPIHAAICIPSLLFFHCHPYQELEKGVFALEKKGIPYKLIAERDLTAQWDELDYLLYHPLGLSAQGKRKLQGFCAAGGTVVSTGNLIGLSNEIALDEWIKEHCCEKSNKETC